ncbi:cytochrome b5 family heme/steroid binding domain-containing protein, partial [Cardiosporidium cionae]
CLLWYRMTKASPPVKEVDEKPPKPFNFPHSFTPQELSEFNGEKNLHSGNPVYVSVCGTVYDVTSHPSGRDLYGSEGTYHVFAGHEATVALSSMSTEPDCLDKLPSTWQNFSLSQRQTIFDWIDKFNSKYDIVGYMKYDTADENAIVKKWITSNSQ